VSPQRDAQHDSRAGVPPRGEHANCAARMASRQKHGPIMDLEASLINTDARSRYTGRGCASTRMVTRRNFLKSPVILSASAALAAQRRGVRPRRVIVVGAGAFGGWTALHLRRAGAEVTLVDAWGPGNARASSGGETRVIRCIYGPTRRYVEMAARALTLWRAWDGAAGDQFYRRTGVLWMTGADDSYVAQSLPFLRESKLEYEHLDAAAAAKRWPQISFDGIAHAVFEREAGYLLARRACDAVARELVRLGGTYQQIAVASVQPDRHRPSVLLGDGTRLEADNYVFACGPWLGQLFPDVIGPRVKPTRQEVFYFGTPAGDERFVEPRLPVWVDLSGRFVYGIPGNLHRGFKVADDTRGPEFDPTSGERSPTPEGERAARSFISRRFPLLKDAPVLGAEVCQYENSPDGHFIIDRHPAMPDVWIAGGGSGHGYKMGPALGELLARQILDDASPDPFFTLERLKR
jgi:sarcosine oxidase